MSKKKVLLIAYGGGHINLLIPIYYELKSRNYLPIVIGLTTACETLEREGIEFQSFKDFLDVRDKDALLLGEKIAGNMTLNPKVPYEETVAYMGVCYQELIEDHGVEGAQALYEQQGRQSFLPIRYMRRILESITPEFIVTTTSPRSEEAMVYAASEKHVPCYCVVDFGYDLSVSERLGQPGFANKIFVCFEAVKDRLIELGRSPQEVEVAGNPVFDFLCDFSVDENRKVFRQEKGWGEKFVILWIKSVSEVVQSVEFAVEKALIEAFSENRSIKLVFRPHPNDVRDYSGLNENVCLSTGEDLVRLVVAASDIVVTVNSTVGIEANLMGKPVVEIDMVDYPSKIPFSKLRIGDNVRSIGSLIAYINEAMSSKEHNLTKPCFSVGNSSLKIVDGIEADLN